MGKQYVRRALQVVGVGSEIPGAAGLTSPSLTLFNAAPLTWTDMPAAATFYNGNAGFIQRVNLEAYSQIRLDLFQGTAGLSGADIKLRYSTSNDDTVGNYTNTFDLTGDALSLEIGTGGNDGTTLTTDWVDLKSAAKTADIFMCVIGEDGDGTEDPVIGQLNVYVR